ncbi:MAG: glycosyltransferase family 2 protein [Gammaproteobacteria bacterium]|nr:glycosyltransferase family 2 protein [Gammaproteobacteria bacterium]MCY4356430.1 glycosyltransferase family 2 protein [Gammaproteobacteria bacterium]
MSASQAPALAVLLSTYNGEQFLPEQLDSLFRQSYEKFVIVVRDDESSDNTRTVLDHYAEQYPQRMHLVPVPEEPANTVGKNLGASSSYGFLLQYVLDNKKRLGLDSAYVLLCDQDDVWVPDKVENQLRQMLDTEQQIGTNKPVLVHSDLRVVNENLQVIAESLVRFQSLETERNRFCQMVVSNLVTGCTAMLNESLARKALPFSDRAIMHDWWLALVAAAFGKVIFMDQPLVQYRQHGKNAIGAKEYPRASQSWLDVLRRLISLKPNSHLQEVARQAQAFLVQYGKELSPHERKGLQQACKMRVPIGHLQRLAYRRARRF